MNPRYLAVSLLLFGCSIESQPEQLSTEESELFVDGNHVWARPARIPVCFESTEPGSANARRWTREAVEATWSRHADVNFSGWGWCTSTSRGIRIRWADETARVEALGTLLDGMKGGMTLNNVFQMWGSSCADTQELCIKAIATHEFGHVLGFAHEQNRSDTPTWCDQDQGSDGTYTIGAWDKNSIMNYCSDDWNNNGELSPADIDGVQRVYGRKQPGSIVVGTTGRCVDLRGGSAAGAAQLYDCHGGDNQEFGYSASTRAFFSALDSTRSLASTYDNGFYPLTTAVWNYAESQRFDFKNVAIVAAGRCIDVPSASTTPGTQVQLFECHGGTNQQWTYTANRELKTPGGLCLGFRSSAAGAPLEIQTCNFGSLQRFLFDRGGLMRSEGASCAAPSSSFTLYNGNCTLTNARQFALRGGIRGIYGFCIDAPGGAAGQSLYMHNCNGGLNQEFDYYP